MVKQSILLFDGVCNLCNGAVRFVYKRDKNKLFCYHSLQSEKAKQLLAEQAIREDMRTIVLFHEGKVFTKSTAALKVGQLLGFPYASLGIFYIVPRFIRDAVYEFIATNRYKWFGKRNEVCEFDPEFNKKTQWKK